MRPKIDLSKLLTAFPVKPKRETEGKMSVKQAGRAGRGQQWRLGVGLGAAILLLLVALSGLALGSDGVSETGSAEDQATSEPAVVAEVVDQRTATSQTFRLSDGQLETRLYQTPVNYRDAEGDWQPIEQELQQSNNGTVSNGDNAFDVQLPEDLDQAPAKLSIDGEWISQMPTGIAVAPAEVDEGVVSYEAAGGAAEMQYSGLANGLKENIILSDAAAPSTFRYKLDASPGVVPTLAGNGSIAFRPEGDEDPVAMMPAPVMVDSADQLAPTGAASYNLEDDGDSWILTVEADPGWLRAEDRSWPVTIDPSVTVPMPSTDCIIANTTENKMCGTAGYGYLTSKVNYLSSGPDQLARTLLRFNVTSIPKGSSLTSATIGLYSAKTATNVTKVDLYDINAGWTADASWIYTSAFHVSDFKWKTPGGTYGSFMTAPASVTPAQRGGSGPGWWNFSSPDLTLLVQGWLDRTIDVEGVKGANSGVILKLADEAPHTCCFERRVEWESSAGTNKPYLSVTYIPSASSDSQITSPTDGTTSAKRFILTSAWDHSNVEGVKFQYRLNRNPPPKTLGEVQKPTDLWADIPASQVIDQNNQTVTWPVGVNVDDRSSKPLYWNAGGVIVPGDPSARIQIRAVLNGSPGAGGYTKAVEVDLDKVNGGVKDTFARSVPDRSIF